jgi:hypothetical protein
MRTVAVVLLVPLLALAKVPARPRLDSACKTASDCGWTYFDEACCGGCAATVGSRRWVDEVARVCDAHPGKQCRAPACGAASVTIDCVNGTCVRKH